MKQVIAALMMVGLLGAQAAAAPAAKEKPLKAGDYTATAKAFVCSACAARAETTLKAVPGIGSLSVSQETAVVRFTVKKGAPVRLEDLQTALKAASDKMGMGANYTLQNVTRVSDKAAPVKKN